MACCLARVALRHANEVVQLAHGQLALSFPFLLLHFQKVFEGLCAEFAVVRSVFDVRMAKPQLKSARVMASVGQEMPASVAQHVRISVRQARTFASRCHPRVR